MLRAIFFDFNGVIIDDEDYHFEDFRKVLGEEGFVLTQETYFRDCLGFNDFECFRWGLKGADRIDKAGGMEQLVNRKSACYEELLKQDTRFFPGVCDLIREAATRYPLAVASMALRREIDWALRHARVASLFSVIVSGEDVERPKPAPDVYQKALDLVVSRLPAGSGQEDMPPVNCLAIEDSVPGVRAARAAGMRVLGVAHTVESQELREADWTLPSLEGVSLNELERLFSRPAVP